MLRIINDNALGSQPKIIPTTRPHIKLDTPAPTKRMFPKENITETLNFNKFNRVYAMPNEKPTSQNNYTNSYPSSITKLTFKEANPSKLF